MSFVRSSNNNNSSSSSATTIPSSLTKQCLQLHHPNQRYTSEAIELSSELLKLFVVEARRRAAIEAECEAETKIDNQTSNNNNNQDDDDDVSLDSLMRLDDDDMNNTNNKRSKSKEKNTTKKSIEIRADHIAKIAAELLMDLS